MAKKAGNASGAIRFALAQVGKQYVYGSNGPNTFDCSSLVMRAYESIGYSLPRTTFAMLDDSQLQHVSKANLAPGDLVFPEAGHVQMYLGGGKIVEAAHTGVPIRVTGLGTVWQARRVTAPGSGSFGSGVSTTTSVSSGVDAATQQAAFASTVSQGLGTGIADVMKKILVPVLQWLFWAVESSGGLALMLFGLFLLIKGVNVNVSIPGR